MAVCAYSAKVDMTQDEIIEMATQVSERNYGRIIFFEFEVEELEAFAKLVAAKAAAKAIKDLESQEPVAYLCTPDENGLFGFPTPNRGCKDCFPVYKKPQRTWVGLTDDEFNELYDRYVPITCYALLIEKVEAKLKEKNCVG